MVIYKITNNINGKIYIGQTTCSLNKRMREHMYGCKYPLQRAIKKYGINSFSITIIDEATSRDTLNEKEIYWIKFYNCKNPIGYNLTDGGTGTLGHVHSCETRKKIGDSSKGRPITEKFRQDARERMLGKKLSDETKKKLSDAIKGRIVSEETRKKLSLARKGYVVPEETRKKLSIINTGKKMDDETKKKISEANKCHVQSEETKAKYRLARKGVPVSEKARINIQNAHKIYWETRRKESKYGIAAAA